jgi:signal transduction histidine kinase
MIGAAMTEVLATQRLGAMATVANAALSAVDRTAFLPIAAREAAFLLGADVAEIWVRETDGPALAAAHRRGDAAPRPLPAERVTESFDGPLNLDDWYAVPIPAEGRARGSLVLHRVEPFDADDLAAAEGMAAVIGVGMAASNAASFDETSRDQFLALLGHDLRSPLSNVRVGAQLARRNLEAGDIESVREALTIIESQSARLVARLEALLDAVAASGRRLMRLETLDLAELAAAAIGSYRLAAEEAGSGTRFVLDASPETPRVRGDAGQLGQVLEHLLDNAAKYSPGGEIRVTLRQEGGMARVDVCDTGMGIRPEEVERVFMPFGRGHAGAGKEGYGLGLYLARNIVSAHGGQLWIARTSRSGTCMGMRLPAVLDSEPVSASRFGTKDGA